MAPKNVCAPVLKLVPLFVVYYSQQSDFMPSRMSFDVAFKRDEPLVPKLKHVHQRTTREWTEVSEKQRNAAYLSIIVFTVCEQMDELAFREREYCWALGHVTFRRGFPADWRP